MLCGTTFFPIKQCRQPVNNTDICKKLALFRTYQKPILDQSRDWRLCILILTLKLLIRTDKFIQEELVVTSSSSHCMKFFILVLEISNHVVLVDALLRLVTALAETPGISVESVDLLGALLASEYELENGQVDIQQRHKETFFLLTRLEHLRESVQSYLNTERDFLKKSARFSNISNDFTEEAKVPLFREEKRFVYLNNFRKFITEIKNIKNASTTKVGSN